MVCMMSDILAECLQPIEDVYCQACCLLELGESLADLSARTNRGLSKSVYYKRVIDERVRVKQALASRPRGVSRHE